VFVVLYQQRKKLRIVATDVYDPARDFGKASQLSCSVAAVPGENVTIFGYDQRFANSVGADGIGQLVNRRVITGHWPVNLTVNPRRKDIPDGKQFDFEISRGMLHSAVKFGKTRTCPDFCLLNDLLIAQEAALAKASDANAPFDAGYHDAKPRGSSDVSLADVSNECPRFDINDIAQSVPDTSRVKPYVWDDSRASPSLHGLAADLPARS
jgi:hypothetical protein